MTITASDDKDSCSGGLGSVELTFNARFWPRAVLFVRMVDWLVGWFTAYQPFFGLFNAELSHLVKSFKQFSLV